MWKNPEFTRKIRNILYVSRYLVSSLFEMLFTARMVFINVPITKIQHSKF